MKYHAAFAPTKPAFGCFCRMAKAEYWALMWATFLLCLAGTSLGFENTFLGLFTKPGFDLLRTVHFHEPTLAIIVWSCSLVIFNPNVHPMNLAWLTGRMSEGEMLEEHPLPLAALKAEEANAKDVASPPPGVSPPPSPPK